LKADLTVEKIEIDSTNMPNSLIVKVRIKNIEMDAIGSGVNVSL